MGSLADVVYIAHVHIRSASCFAVLSLLAPVACSSATPATTGPSDGGRSKDARASPPKDAAPPKKGDGGDGGGAHDAATAKACMLAVPSPPDWRLVTDGTLLKDGLGRTVFLRGVDAGGRSKFAPYVPFDYADGGYATALDAFMARAETWGIDSLRVPFTWAALEPTQSTPPTYDTAWIAQYVALLQAAWQHGMYTVVDFHQDVYSEVYCGDGFPGWTVADAGPPEHDCPQWSLEYFEDPSVEAAFDAFWPMSSPTMAGYFAAWDQMISQTANVPGVIGFEPINEPSSGSVNNMTFEPTTLTPFFSAIATEMNTMAPKALVFFDPTGVDGVSVTTTLQKPLGQNLVFAPHFYPIGVPSPADVQTKLAGWAGYGTMWNVPVWVGEFGASNSLASTLGYMQSVFDGFDALGLSGELWEYSQSVDLWNSETNSVVNPQGVEFPVAQALIRPFARAVAGADIAESFNTTTGTYTLSYTATDGVTEVRLPARAYPNGFDVSLEGACFDGTDAPGELLLQGTAGAKVSMTVVAKAK